VRRYLAAWTAPSGSFPPYINASSTADPAFVRVTVRSNGGHDLAQHAAITMPRDAAKHFALELLQSIGDQELAERVEKIVHDAVRSGRLRGLR